MARAHVLRTIAENQAFYDAEYNAAFVEMQYFGYLRCNPQDPPDNNLNGYNFWLNKLNEFGGASAGQKWSRHFSLPVSIGNASALFDDQSSACLGFRRHHLNR